MEPILEIIEALKTSNNSSVSFDVFGKKEDDENIQRVLRNKNLTLPSDYLTLIKTFGECAVSGPDTEIIFWAIGGIMDQQLDSASELNDVFAFASDNGGNFYFYDVHNRSGKGKYSIFDVYPGNQKWEYSTYLAPDLCTLIGRIVNGESFINPQR